MNKEQFIVFNWKWLDEMMRSVSHWKKLNVKMQIKFDE